LAHHGALAYQGNHEHLIAAARGLLGVLVIGSMDRCTSSYKVDGPSTRKPSWSGREWSGTGVAWEVDAAGGV